MARVSTLQQPLGVLSGEPTAVFRDPNGNHVVLCFVNCFHNGSRRQQRNFMLAAASAEQDADPEFSHSLSVWPESASEQDYAGFSPRSSYHPGITPELRRQGARREFVPTFESRSPLVIRID